MDIMQSAGQDSYHGWSSTTSQVPSPQTEYVDNKADNQTIITHNKSNIVMQEHTLGHNITNDNKTNYNVNNIASLHEEIDIDDVKFEEYILEGHIDSETYKPNNVCNSHEEINIDEVKGDIDQEIANNADTNNESDVCPSVGGHVKNVKIEETYTTNQHRVCDDNTVKHFGHLDAWCGKEETSDIWSQEERDYKAALRQSKHVAELAVLANDAGQTHTDRCHGLVEDKGRSVVSVILCREEKLPSGVGLSNLNLSGVSFKCDLCPYHCDSEQKLTDHTEIHHVEYRNANNKNVTEFTGKESERFTLDESANDTCYKVFRRKDSLVNHINKRKTDTCRKEKQKKVIFTCDICTKSFNVKNNLNRHKLRQHSDEMRYSCNICRKTFKEKYRLQEHMAVHSVEKPYSCDICRKSFSGRTALQKHFKTHAVPKFSCEVCGKAFSEMYKLQNHLKIHSDEKPFSCNMCNKSFGVKLYLQKHLKTHSGEKPHSCKICQRSYIFKHSLTKHMRRNHDKRYTCDACKKGYKRKRSLRNHIQSQHSD